MKLSIPLSIHNRGALLRRALETFLWQSLPASEWEVILIDDRSTEDLREAYGPFLGKINLRHVYFDHTFHSIFRKRNPNWKPGDPEDWFKTPALTTNAGCYLSRAPFVGLFHPEVLHAPGNFETAVEILSKKDVYVFGKVWLGNWKTNKWLEAHPEWSRLGWANFLDEVKVTSLRAFSPDELYWYCSFLPKRVVEEIGGVDFAYLSGNSYEDCDFRERVIRKRCPALWEPAIQGIHQDHSQEKEAHRIRNARWYESEMENEFLFRNRDFDRWTGGPANDGIDWTAKECISRIVEYRLGSEKPIEIPWAVGTRA